MSFPLYSSLCSSTHSPCFWSWPLTDKVIFLKHKSHYSITLLKILSWLLNVACHTQYFSNDELLASQVRLFFVDHCIPSLPVALLTQSPPQCVGTILGWGQLHNLPSFLNNALHLIFYNHLPHASLLEPECTISSLLGYATSLSYDRALVMLLSPSCCSCPSLKHSEFKTQLRHYLFSEAFPSHPSYRSSPTPPCLTVLDSTYYHPANYIFSDCSSQLELKVCEGRALVSVYHCIPSI